MTKNLKKNEHVLRLILENNHELNKCIFSYIKDKSIKAIVEIIYNVWNLPLNKNQKKKFVDNYKILQKFIRQKIKRRHILISHYILFSNLLHILRKYIYQILK